MIAPVVQRRTSDSMENDETEYGHTVWGIAMEAGISAPNSAGREAIPGVSPAVN
jgi:hypothetical protein